MDIYLDNSATTPIRQEALDKYIEVSRECYGNPSSLHAFGFMAEKKIKEARDIILSSVGDRTSSAVFTASGSEANNLAIFGRAYAKDRYKRGKKIITTAGEHASVDAPLSRLEGEGFRIVRIPTLMGEIDMSRLRDELDGDVILVSMMLVNNETGAVYDIASVSRLMRERSPEAVLHVDATQGYMKLPLSKKSLGYDMITLSSHKIHGPKGVGALLIDDKIIRSKGISPRILGGGQEGGLRSGTENVPAISAFGEAVRLGVRDFNESYNRLLSLHGYLVDKIKSSPMLSEVSLTLPPSHAPHILNITLPKIKSETMLHYLSSLGIYVSSGSACSSNSQHNSSALIAYGKDEAEADCSIRISLSYQNSTDDIDALIAGLESGISRLAKMR